MYVRICRFIGNWFQRSGTITSEEQEVFEFGLERIISQLVSMLLLFALGLLYRGFLESVVFYFCFYYSRKFAGGYHADTYVKCNTLYLFTFTATLFGSRFLLSVPIIVSLMVIISVFVMLTTILLAPINNPNNPILPGKENGFYLLAIVINAALSGISFVFLLINRSVAVFLIVTLLMSAIFMLIEVMKRSKGNMSKIKAEFSKKIAKLVMKNAEKSTREVSTRSHYQAKRPEVLNKKD